MTEKEIKASKPENFRIKQKISSSNDLIVFNLSWKVKGLYDFKIFNHLNTYFFSNFVVILLQNYIKGFTIQVEAAPSRDVLVKRSFILDQISSLKDISTDMVSKFFWKLNLLIFYFIFRLNLIIV